MFTVYYKLVQGWLDFPYRIFYPHRSYATDFPDYDTAEQACEVMEARGYTGLCIEPARKLARDTSQLTQTGGDPYNTADTLKVTRDQAADFAQWASGNGS